MWTSCKIFLEVILQFMPKYKTAYNINVCHALRHIDIPLMVFIVLFVK